MKVKDIFRMYANFSQETNLANCQRSYGLIEVFLGNTWHWNIKEKKDTHFRRGLGQNSW